jgi:O-antigen/teichoic acid export membrane protein
MSLLIRAGEQARAGRVRLKSDHLLYNSFYLALTTSTMGVLGFLFWLLNARLFNASQIGEATLLISATSLISYLSLLGFNNTLIRFLPTAEDPVAQINTGLLLCFGASMVLGSLYVLGLPIFAPSLTFIRDSPWYAIGFVFLTACSAVNLLTDSVFIAYRKAQYNFVVDGVIQSGSKLSLPLLLVGLGTFGIFASAGIASGLAVLFSLYFMKRALNYRPAFQVKLESLRSALSFSAASYVSNLLNLIPLLVLPVIVLDTLGAASAGYYFLAFQMANLLYSVAFAVTESLLAEGSQHEVDLKRLARHSATVLGILIPFGGLLLAGSSHWLLLLFGRSYSQHATTALMVLGIAAVAVTTNVWASAMLKVTKQLSAMICANVMYAVVIIGLAAAWAHRGLVWVALAWLLGNIAASAVACGALVIGRRQPVWIVPVEPAIVGSPGF